jgi:hypothetical protein
MDANRLESDPVMVNHIEPCTGYTNQVSWQLSETDNMYVISVNGISVGCVDSRIAAGMILTQVAEKSLENYRLHEPDKIFSVEYDENFANIVKKDPTSIFTRFLEGVIVGSVCITTLPHFVYTSKKNEV